MTKTPLNVLIVGGGIAGSVAAMALVRAGHRATVFEAYDRGADGIGAFLTLAVNGIDALGALGIDGAALGGFETPRMAMRLGDGTRLAEFDAGPALASGARCRTLSRGELYANLRDEAARRGVAFEYGKRLVDAERQRDGRVVARFGDGTAAEGDLLVGADGLHSRVRAIIDPAAPRAHYLGLLNTGGYARGVAVPAAPGTMEFVFGKRCFFGYAARPDGEVWWFANPARAREPDAAELAAITPAAWRATLLELFADDATPAAALIRATEQPFRPWSTHDFPRVPRWHRDGMVLIGDAAHAASPSSGQGASMAIEDAVVLGRCVRDAQSVDAAIVAYEAQRRARVERVVALGRRNGTGKTPGPVGRVLRDFFLRRYFGGAGRDPTKGQEWVYNERVAWDAPGTTATSATTATTS